MKQSIQKRFGDVVRRERIRLGISQEELGFRSNLHRTYVTGVERGKRNPSLNIIAKLSKGWERSLRELFTKSEGDSCRDVGAAKEGRKRTTNRSDGRAAK